LCVFVGVTHDDTPELAERLARRVWSLRIMDDSMGVMNLSVGEVAGAVLVVSQFTLYGDTSRGRRPSWRAAAPGEAAEPLVDAVASALADLGATVATGTFGATMSVELVNDGPVTVLVEV
jgi:D-tyrosyl-tRNA(Tyr) deacylase